MEIVDGLYRDPPQREVAPVDRQIFRGAIRQRLQGLGLGLGQSLGVPASSPHWLGLTLSAMCRLVLAWRATIAAYTSV